MTSDKILSLNMLDSIVLLVYKILAVSFLVNRTNLIMKVKDTNYYQGKLEAKEITLVEQKYKKKVTSLERAEVWNVCRRLVEHPQDQPLPTVYKEVLA